MLWKLIILHIIHILVIICFFLLVFQITFFLKELLLLLEAFILSTFLPPENASNPCIQILPRNSIIPLLFSFVLCVHSSRCLKIFLRICLYILEEKNKEGFFEAESSVQVLINPSGYQRSRLDRRPSQTDCLFLPNLFLSCPLCFCGFFL